MVGSSTNSLVNAFQGGVSIGAVDYNATAGAFYISYGNLGREACVSILTADWGSGPSSGFLAIKRANGSTADLTAATESKVPTADATNSIWVATSLPIPPADAATACQDYNKITWFYQ